MTWSSEQEDHVGIIFRKLRNRTDRLYIDATEPNSAALRGQSDTGGNETGGTGTGGTGIQIGQQISESDSGFQGRRCLRTTSATKANNTHSTYLGAGLLP